MKNVIMTIILFALCAALVVGVILPLSAQIRQTGQNSLDTLKTLNANMKGP